VDSLNLEITLDPSLPCVVEGAVSYDMGAQSTGLHIYGPPSPLVSFFEDLISGTSMPLRFATHRISNPHTVLAATLFFSRDIALHSSLPAMVYLVDLEYRKGEAMLAHAPSDLARFLRGLKSFFPAQLPKREQGERLVTAMQWVRAYVLEGTLPDMGPRQSSVQLLDVGSNGFVIAEGNTTKDTWDMLFRAGHLKGFVVSSRGEVIAARKSKAVGFDLEGAAPILDELERHSESKEGWILDGDYLRSPPSGSAITLQHLTEVFLRR